MADDVVGKLIFKVETDADGAKKGLDDFQDELKDTQSEAKKTDNEVSKASDNISIKAVAIATAVGTAVVKMSKEIVKATASIQSGQKIIVNATGASGKALEGLMQSAQNVFASSDDTFDDVASAIGEINTRLGLTGNALESTTKTFLDFADATGQDVQQSVIGVTQAMNKWGLETDKLPALLDKLTLAGQLSGISVAELTTNLTANAGTLQSMGYSMDEAISMMMQFESQGIDTSSVIMGMKKSFEDSAKAGTDARTDWENLLDSIANATDETDANRIAVETFGNRIATDMVASLRSGALEFDKFTEAIANSQGTLNATDESAKTTADRIAEFKNRVTVALANIGTALAPLVDTALPKLATGIETALGFLSTIVTAFTGNKTAVDDLQTSVGSLSTAIETYRTATANATTDVDNMTDAERRLYKIQQDRAKLEVDKSMKDVADAFAGANKQMDESQSILGRLQGNLLAYNIALEAEETSNGNVEKSIERLIEARNFYLELQMDGIELTEEEKATFDTLTNLINTRSIQGTKYASNLEEAFISTYSSIIEKTNEYNEASIEQEKSMQTLANAVEQGLLDLDKYRVLYPELVTAIEGYIQKTSEATEAEEEAVGTGTELKESTEKKTIGIKDFMKATVEATEATEDNTDAEKEAERLANERQKTTDGLNKRLLEQDNLIRKQSADELELAGNVEQAYAIRMQLLGEEYQRELATLKAKIEANEATEDDIVTLNRIYAGKRAQISADMNKAIEDRQRKRVEAEKKAEEELTKKTKEEEEARIRANDEANRDRVEKYNEANKKISDALSWVTTSMGSALQNMIHVLTNDLATVEEKVNSVKQAVGSFVGLTGNMLSELGKAIASEEQDWVGLGRTALKALASIVRALAEEMAARAVLAAFSYNWTGAAALTAGSVAAFVGAGLIDGYADSLLIGKDYVPYDEYPARLHRGEMVLDRIDAEKLRRYGGMYGVEQMASQPLGMDMKNLSPLNINNQLSAVIEVDGTQLGIAVLKNIDNASQFVLR